MGAFLLGVFVAVVAEWLFYNFWIKPKDGEGDCSSLKAELELKNRQISSLQNQLSSISDANSKKSVKPASKASSIKTSQTKVTSKKTSSETSNKKTATKAKMASAKTKPKSITKPASKKSTSNKTSKAQNRRKKISGDDFTKLSGIGPSMSATLKSLGIDSFKKLAATDDDILRDLLESSGARMNNNKDVMDSWNEQATLAAKGDFATLKQMQANLKK